MDDYNNLEQKPYWNNVTGIENGVYFEKLEENDIVKFLSKNYSIYEFLGDAGNRPYNWSISCEVDDNKEWLKYGRVFNDVRKDDKYIRLDTFWTELFINED
jgi:hypothetical protein